MRKTPRALHPDASLVLHVLYQHRLLSTSQLARMLMPASTLRRMQRVLAQLADRKMVTAVPSPGRTGPGRVEHLWFLTPLGAEAAEADPKRAEPRRRLLKRELAEGRHHAHTLAVNEVGIAFLHAARERGHDFGPFSWQHEVAHQLQDGRPERVIADAVLRYWTVDATGGASLRYRFLELDRANVALDVLAARLSRYARLHQAWSDDPRPLAQRSYRTFPRVLVVLDNEERADLERRRQTLIALCRDDFELFRPDGVSISFVLLADLVRDGPFAPVFRHLDDDRHVNWLGHASATEQKEEAP